LPVVIFSFVHRWLRGLSVCGSAALFWAVATSSSAQLLVVLSDESGSYQEVVEALRTGVAPVREGRIRINVVTAQHLASGDASVFAGTELVVTVGLAAAQATIAREAALPTPPVTLCLLIPRQSYERLIPPRASGRERRLSAVFIDQPLSRQLDLIRIALPNRFRVGVILGPSSELLKDELRDKARERALVPKFAEVVEASGVYGALQKVLPESDLLLALPDPVAVNASTAYGLLLTSYRAQVPVIGFSEGMAKAGALLSLFSTASQQGKQGAEIVSRILAGASELPAPQYSKYFTVRVNFSVARSLGLRIEEEATLAAALAARGDGVGESIPRRSASDNPTLGRTP
jgi:putative tryptophan/tyrosine transport system substrate-binding protein